MCVQCSSVGHIEEFAVCGSELIITRIVARAAVEHKVAIDESLHRGDVEHCIRNALHAGDEILAVLHDGHIAYAAIGAEFDCDALSVQRRIETLIWNRKEIEIVAFHSDAER